MFQYVSKSLRYEAVNEIKRHYAHYYRNRIEPLKGPTVDFPEVTLENQEEALKNAVAPLSMLPYTEQLELKNEYISYVVSRYFSILKEDQSKSKKPQLPISKPKILDVFPSPIRSQYRSKDTFMVRPGVDGNPKTVGHIVGRPSLGKYVCVPPVDILSPPCHSQVAKAFEDYIRQSELPACENFKDGGHWTQIQVRSNKEGETMLVVNFRPESLTEVVIQDECKKLKEYFETGPGSALNLTSLYFQSSPYSHSSGKVAPFQLLFGSKTLMEELNGRTFALSPGSFFQSNRKVAELMYEKIFTLANLSPFTSLLDLGCGIGTISILASPFVRGTIGIDMSAEAIEDAKFNASLNNNFSANFLTGSIEKKLNTALKLLEASSTIVAILNPGRCGVDVSVIQALRQAPHIETVIYVACQPDHEWVIRNVLALIKNEGGKHKGPPFKFKSVVPFDMFPQTTHCEVVMKFVR